MAQRVVILGAGGFTGQLILERLNLPGVETVLAGRKEDSAKGIRAVDVQDPAQVDALVKAGDIVVNCVGPFNLYSRDLAAQLARKGIAYLDISGEQSFVSHSYAAIDTQAREHGSLLLHACAFESFFAVMLAQLCCQAQTRYLDISSYYWFENGSPSPGTALTMRVAGHFETVIYEQGAWAPKAPKAVSRPFQLPPRPDISQAIFVPYPEIEFFPRMFKTKGAASYFAMSDAEAAMFQNSSGGAKREIADVLKKHRASPRPGPDAAERKKQGVAVAVEAKAEDGHTSMRWVTGVDPYGLTAAIIVWCCARLLELKERPSGVLSPSQVFSAGAFLEEIKVWKEFDIQMGSKDS